MSIHPDMKAGEKAVWMCLIGLLVVVEFNAIRADKRATDVAAENERAARNLQYRSQMESQNQAFLATKGQLLTQEEESRKDQLVLTKGIDDNLNALTGGDSYCFISRLAIELDAGPTGKISGWAQLSKIGEWPLYGVRVKVIHYILSADPNAKAYGGAVVQLPDLASGNLNAPDANGGLHTGTAVDGFRIPEGMDLSGGRADMILDYQGRSRPWRQILHVVVVNNTYFNDTTVIRGHKILYRHVDSGFPKDGYPWRSTVDSADH
jgi:hypothetical protein